MRFHQLTLLVLGMFLLAGCDRPERVLKTPGSEVAFRISVEKAESGEPRAHYITPVQVDNTELGKTLLTTQRRDVSQLFSAVDKGPYILITVGQGERRTLWLIFNRTTQKFESTQNLGLMTNTAREAGLTVRDPNVFLGQ